MAAKVFISYRRGEDSGYTQALYDRLVKRFGRRNVFLDVGGDIRAGDELSGLLAKRIGTCTVVLAVVGPSWLDLADASGSRRLDNPADWVRFEILAAFAGNKRIIPVLVNNARCPGAADLPPALGFLAERNAVSLTPLLFNEDCERLCREIELVAREEPVRELTTSRLTASALACLGTAGLFAWMAHALLLDASVPRALPYLFMLPAFVLVVVGITAFRRLYEVFIEDARLRTALAAASKTDP